MKSSNIKTILISRTDSIGDVVLTLPMAGFIKQHFPGIRIIFLGKNYTREVVALSKHVDEFISYDDLKQLTITEQINYLQSRKIDCIVHVLPNKNIAVLAKKARIPIRVGTTNRLHHWFTCNKLVRLSRKNSNLHESQLNLILLKLLGNSFYLDLIEIEKLYGFEISGNIPEKVSSLIDKNKINVILHPKSKGSAREWGINNFSELVNQLDKTRYKIFVCGTKEEGLEIAELFQNNSDIENLTGIFSLKEYIQFISLCQALVAASTGPLHLAASLGKQAIGLYPPIRPMHPGRWAPIGKNAHVIVFNNACSDCRNGAACHCMTNIQPMMAKEILDKI